MSFINIHLVIQLTRPLCTFIADLPRANAAMQQAICRTLGVLAYQKNPSSAPKVIDCLLALVDEKVL